MQRAQTEHIIASVLSRGHRRLSPQYLALSAATRELLEQRWRRRRHAATQRWMRHIHRARMSLSSLRCLLFPIAAIACAILLVAGIIILLFSPWTAVQEIRVVQRDPRVDVADVQHALAPLFGRRLFAIGNTEVLSLHQPLLPDLAHVDVDAAYPSLLQLHIRLTPLAARLRIVEPDGTVTGTGTLLQDFLTEDGIAVAYTPVQVKDAGALPLLYVTDWEVRPRPGGKLVDPPLLTALQEVEEILERDFGQEVRERLFLLRAREFHLHIASWWLWFDVREGIAEEMQRYRLFLQHVPREQVRSYVDLRLHDRVVYK